MDLAVHSGFTDSGDYKPNWITTNQMLVFGERGKPEFPGKKPLKTEYRTNKLNHKSTYDSGLGNRTRATLVEGECSHHCANPAL